MNKDLIVSKSIEIEADAKQVWEVLTQPKMIKLFLFGTQTITDWEINSPIIFKGEYDGHHYEDKGIVIKNEKHSNLVYRYWSSFSGLPDTLENYSTVSYIIETISNHKTKFSWVQKGFAKMEGKIHLSNTLPDILQKIKSLAENK